MRQPVSLSSKRDERDSNRHVIVSVVAKCSTQLARQVVMANHIAKKKIMLDCGTGIATLSGIKQVAKVFIQRHLCNAPRKDIE